MEWGFPPAKTLYAHYEEKQIVNDGIKGKLIWEQELTKLTAWSLTFDSVTDEYKITLA